MPILMPVFAFEILLSPHLIIPMIWLTAVCLWLMTRGNSVTGTTFAAVRHWALISAVCVGSVEIAVASVFHDLSKLQIEALRLAGACTTICPPIALLGAKRPQNRAWQWIVISLWMVVLLPVAHRLMFATIITGGGLELPAIWSWFLLLLTMIGGLNYLGTRHGWSAIGYSLGQMALMAPHLPQGQFVSELAAEYRIWFAMGAFFAAIGGVIISRCKRHDTAKPLDRMWLDFRDLYGAGWAIRIAGRFNELAEKQPSPVRLNWKGVSDSLSPEASDQARRLLCSLLSRFVNSRWIEDRKIDIKITS